MEIGISGTSLIEYSDKNEPALSTVAVSSSIPKISRKIIAYSKLEPSSEGKDERSAKIGEKGTIII